MNIETSKHKKLFQLSMISQSQRKKVSFFSKGRILIGKSETCDYIVDHPSVSVIHAVLEIFDDHAIIYDMNSSHGVFFNNEKVIVQKIIPGEVFQLAQMTVAFNYFNNLQDLPPVINDLGPQVINDTMPVASNDSKVLPSSVPENKKTPRVIFPLASNPNAEFSEYIFEDSDEIYPIFKYEHDKESLEVIILFKEQVLTIDYLPRRPGLYQLAGVGDVNHQLEFPYLGAQEKIPFINVKDNSTVVFPVPGFDIFCLSETKQDTGHHAPEIELRADDILRFKKDDLQIFIRHVPKPPSVDRAPILKRDKIFRRYLGIFSGIFCLLFLLINFIEVPQEEKNEELASERLATILYKQPLILSNKPVIEKTKNKKNKAQKSPKKIATKPSNEKPTEANIKNPSIIETKNNDQKTVGKKSAKEVKVVKKGSSSPSKSLSQQSSNAQKGSSKSSPTSQISKNTARSQNPTKGHVEVYKSFDFKSSVSSVLAKGGSISGVNTKNFQKTSSLSGVGTSIGGGSGEIKSAKISLTQGSLTGATSGVLGESKGAEGLSSKKTIYTAGIPSETLVFGSMDPDVIRRRLMEFLAQFRSCYQRELEGGRSNINGLINLNFVIGPSGHVVKSGLTNNTTLPSRVSGCVLNVLNGITFPEPKGGGRVEVNQPMNFQPKTI